MASKKELGEEELLQRPFVGFERVTEEENRENSKPESEENSTDGSCQNSPRGVLEIPTSTVRSDSRSSSESSSSIDPSLSPEGTLLECHSSQWRTLIGGLLQRKRRTIARLSTFPSATKASPSCSEKKCARNFRSGGGGEEDDESKGLVRLKVPMRRPCWRNFDYRELVVATDNFSPFNIKKFQAPGWLSISSGKAISRRQRFQRANRSLIRRRI